MKPEDVLKNQLAHILGDNANLICELQKAQLEIQKLRKEVADATAPKTE